MMPRTGTVASTHCTNLRVVRRLMEEVWATGDLSLLPELVATDYVGHFSIGDHYGPVGARIDIESYRHAIPDLTVILADLFSVDDKVVRRFTLFGTHSLPFLGFRASGTRVALDGIAIDHLANGQIVESWSRLDDSPLRNSVGLLS
jgi:predicted ester cyclase